MNKERRKSLDGIRKQLFEIQRDLRRVYNAEQDSYDNLSEGLQQTMRGEESEEAIDIMDEAIENIDNTIDLIGDII